MHSMTIAELAALDSRDYIGEIKARLRDDKAWLELLDPALERRTQWGLGKIIQSIDSQKARITDADPEWVRRAESLRKLAKKRLDKMVPDQALAAAMGTSSTKEARLWRGFSARLALVLREYDPSALEEIQAPYGRQTAAEWLAAREEKRT
jgi:hypothetical protein